MPTETINVTIAEVQPIQVVIQGYSLTSLEELSNYLIFETPTKINAKRFQTSKAFKTGRLAVFINGIKEKYIEIISSTIFEFKIDTVVSDIVEVQYIYKP